jgi:hypothetical protein
MFLRILVPLASFGACAIVLRILREVRFARAHRRQIVFMGETLAAGALCEDRRLVISLSTLPDRINHLRPTLECLRQQTRSPAEIVLTIPSFSIRQRKPYEVPPWLTELPGVRILQTDRDWGPATKFIPVLRQELAAGRADTLVMVVDDDRIYPADAVETYLHFSAQFPEAALCFRGAAMPRTFDWHDAKMIHGNAVREPRPVAVITGCGSYLIKPRFFDSAAWDYAGAPPAAFYMDDIWISGMLDRRHVKKYVVPSSARLRTVAQQSRTMTLHDVPNGRQNNNNELIAYFRESWNVFAAP